MAQGLPGLNALDLEMASNGAIDRDMIDRQPLIVIRRLRHTHAENVKNVARRVGCGYGVVAAINE